MDYPVWDVGFGLPLLIALVAIPHVFVAHFAIGGGFFLAIYEGQALRRGDAGLLGYVRNHSRFFMLLTLVFGAITGVGIWFTIGLIHPAATAALIHAFVWFWATEWVCFFVEITASLVYFYGWDRLSPARHLLVGWVYFIAAWLSLFFINGIITFMLTPGAWLETRNIWQGFFNPTFLPSLLSRTLITFLMAGLFAFLTGSQIRDFELKKRVLRIASLWSLPALALLIPSLLWYFNSLPSSVTNAIAGSWTGLQNASIMAVWAGGLLAVGIIISPLLRPKGMHIAEAIVLLAVGMALFGSLEWAREAARKPFVIAGYMYSSGLRMEDITKVAATGYGDAIFLNNGVLAGMDDQAQGEALFQAACARCHSLDGYNGLAKMIAAKGWDEAQLAELIPRTDNFRAPMPPYLGTPEETGKIAAYLSTEARKIKPTAAPEVTGGERVWAQNCGLCHTLTGFRPLKDTFSGMSESDMVDIIHFAQDISASMPPFYGADADALALAQYIRQSLGEEGQTDE